MMNLQKVSFIALLTAVSLAFLGLLADFLQPVFWAATLAVLFHPVFTKLLHLTRNRRALTAGLDQNAYMPRRMAWCGHQANLVGETVIRFDKLHQVGLDDR